jgi:hypothetical protein
MVGVGWRACGCRRREYRGCLLCGAHLDVDDLWCGSGGGVVLVCWLILWLDCHLGFVGWLWDFLVLSVFGGEWPKYALLRFKAKRLTPIVFRSFFVTQVVFRCFLSRRSSYSLYFSPIFSHLFHFWKSGKKWQKSKAIALTLRPFLATSFLKKWQKSKG